MTASDGTRRAAIRTVVVWVILAAIGGLGLRRLDTDNRPEVFFPRHSTTLDTYNALRASFGEEEPVRLLVSGRELFSAAGLAELERLEREATALPGVLGAVGLAGHHRRFGPWPPADAEAFRQRAIADPLDRGFGWIDASGGHASILVQLEPTRDEQRTRTLDALRRLAASSATGLAVELSGLPLLNEALDSSTREIGSRLFPLLIALSTLLLWLGRGGLSAAVLPLVVVLATEAITLGALGALGVRLNLVLAILPPLLFAVTLATTVHLDVRARQLSGGAPSQAAVRTALEQTRWAIVGSGVTTAVGFGSLALAPLEPVRQLGLAAAFGVAVATAAVFTLAPALLTLAPGRLSQRALRLESAARRLGGRVSSLAVRRRWVVTAAFGAALALLALGLPRLELETDARRYLAPSHPVRRSIERLEAIGIGATSLEVLVETTSETLDSPGGLRQLAELAAAWRQLPGVLGVVSPSDLVADVAIRAAAGLELPWPMALAGLRLDPDGARFLGSLLTSDGRRARVLVFAPVDGVAPTRRLIAALQAASTGLAPGLSLSVSGQLPVLLETQAELLFTLGESLALTLAAVTLLLVVLLRRPWMAVLSIVPNVYPVVATLGLMGWLGVPLDIATVMVAAVTLGLAVDDTLHTLGLLRRLERGCSRRQGVVRVLERTTPAYLSTGAMLVAGFGICAASDFAPTARFGALSASAIAIAVVANLLLLPALLSLPRAAGERAPDVELEGRAEGDHSSIDPSPTPPAGGDGTRRVAERRAEP